MPVTIGGKEQPEYRPFTSRVKRAVGIGGRHKDVNLPLEGSAVPESKRPLTPEETGRRIGKGFRQLRELTSKSRSQSKR